MVALQAPLSMEFSRQEYWSVLPFPYPGDLPDPGIKSRSPALQIDCLLSEPPGGDSNKEIYITICKIDSQWEFAICLRKLKQGLSINLEGWDGDRDSKGRGYMYTYV